MEIPNLEAEVQQLKSEIHTLKCKQMFESHTKAAPTSIEHGAYIAEVDTFNEQFKGMIEKMNEMLASETKVLCGTKQPSYEDILREMEAKPENELSMDKATIQ